ncbi:MAG TPA: GYF domain-containing protein, partial [Polyangiaceae bacterium]|nr:GYF domain-containing protein [Polyangiaceae bacterium]
MESSDSLDKSWDTTSDLTATTALRSDPLASENASSSSSGASSSGGWMVNVAGRDIVEMAEADVIAKWKKRALSSSTLVWREGMDSWAKLESVSAFATLAKSGDEEEEPGSTEETNLVAVYERPMATLVFDEAVEDEWRLPPPKAREPAPRVRGSEPSKGARSVSARPVAPSFPALAPPKSLSVPADEPPPAPPLPARRSAAPQHISRRPMPTIPGGLAPPTPPSTPAAQVSSPSPLPSAPPASALRFSASPAPKSAAPPATTSPAPSPLLAAIAAAASSPEPLVEPSPVPAPASVPEPSAPFIDEASLIARLRGTKTISLRNAVIACAGSALVASLMTGLVVGSRSPEAARPAEPPKAVAAVTTAPALPVAPVAVPTAAPSPPPTSERTSEAPAAPVAEKGALTELNVAEKPKPKATKISTWKPPTPIAASDGPAE